MSLENISLIINLIALVLGMLIFSILILSKGKTFAFKILTANILLLIFFISYSVVLYKGWLQFMPHLFKLPVTLIFLLGPISYLFIRALLNNEIKFHKTDWLHLIPFLLYFIELLPFFLNSVDYKLQIINNIGNQDLIKLIELEVGVFPNSIHKALMQLSNAIYLIAAFNCYRSYYKINDVLSNKEQTNKKSFARVIVLVKLVSILIAMLAVIYHKSNPEIAVIIINVSLSTLLIAIAIMLLINPDFLYGSTYSIVLSSTQKLLIAKKALIKNNLLAMTNSTTEANVFLNTSCHVVYFNVLAEKRIKLIFNVELKIGDDFKNYIQTDVVSLFNESFEKAITGESIFFEIQENNPDTNIAEWFSVSLIPIYNGSEIISGISLKVINIDKIKRIETENQEYIKKLEAIAWQEAHILRAPIANLIGLSRLLKKSGYYEEKEKRAIFINQIYQEVERLNKRINEITETSNQVLLDNLKTNKNKEDTAK
jgi:hypothetical protein